MPYSEKETRRLTELLEGSQTVGEDEDGRMCYKAVPYLREMSAVVKTALEPASERDESLLTDSMAVLAYVADSYSLIGRMSVAADIYRQVLVLAAELYHSYGSTSDITEDVLYNVLKARNFYVDDDCTDIVDLAEDIVPKEKLDRVYTGVMNNRRSLRHDPVEMSREYLSVIDTVERRIEENRTLRGHGSCHQVWSLKAEYLREYEIEWKSPAVLNPRVMFD